MDKLDLEILKHLSKNGRISHEELGKLLSLSRPAIHKRIKKLEEEGIIEHYKAVINWSLLGYDIQSLIYLKINSSNFKEVSERILKVKVKNVALEECHRLAGEWCMLIKVRSSSPQYITNYIDEIWKVEGVKETSTNFILSTLFKE